MGGIFYPDNPDREQRLRSLGAQIDAVAGQIEANSNGFEDHINKLISRLSELKDRLQKLESDLAQGGNEGLLKKIKALLSKIDNWIQPEEKTIVGVPITVYRVVLDFIGGNLAGYATNKAIRNLYTRRFLARLPPRRAFVFRMPRWVRATGIGTGILVAAAVGFAIDSLIQLWTGAELKKELQDHTRDLLNTRFQAQKAKMLGDAAQEVTLKLVGKAESYREMIDRDAERKIDVQGTVDYISEKIDSLVTDFRDAINKVTPEEVLKYLKDQDKGAWVDHEVEDSWSPPTSEEDDEEEGEQ